jgi:hypothetical protein
MKKDQDNQFSDHFKILLVNQDLIDIEMYDDYRWDKTYQDVCSILRKEKYIKEKTFLQSVNKNKIIFFFYFSSSFVKRYLI